MGLFAEGVRMNNYIKRDVDEIIESWDKGNVKSLMILGARQVGKTSSIRHFIRKKYGLNEETSIPEINIATMDGAKELLLSNNGIEGMSFMQYVFVSLGINVDLNKTNIVFIDEIQALSNDKKIKSSGTIKSILSMITKEDGLRFIFSGSLLGAKISNLESLAKDVPGGMEQHRMYPLSFDEFVESIDGDTKYIEDARKSFERNENIKKDTHIHLLKKFSEYSFVGGMPKAVVAYIEDKKYNVNDSLSAILSLTSDYNVDVAKYFRDEYGVEIGEDVFNCLLFGLKQNNKKILMKKLKSEPMKKFYEYVVDSDVGLLIPHIDEINMPLSKQESPKTYFNDIGFMRCLLKEHIDGVEDKKNPPKYLKSYFDVRDLEIQKKGFIDWIDGNATNKPKDNGAFFEQVVAQCIKAKSYQYAYNYRANPEQENEFILLPDLTAIEIKSGGFADRTSSIEYAKSGKRVLFVTMLPYIGEYTERFILLPIYLLCFLKQDEILKHSFVEASKDAKEVVYCGLLPDNPGFYRQ